MLSIIKGPYLQMPTQDSLVVMWETSEDAHGQVTIYETRQIHASGTGQFHTLEAAGRVIEEASPARRIHQVALTGLTAETVYHYQVRSQTATSELVNSPMHVLKTAVRTSTPFSFTVTSETGGGYPDVFSAEIFARMKAYRPDFLLMVGDAVSSGTSYEDWALHFFEPGAAFLHDTPFYLCLGNHEENAHWYYEFTAFPEPKNYYAFRYGNAHFIALDSTAIVDFEFDAERRSETKVVFREPGFVPGTAQYDFLVRELEGSDAQWKIVFFHYPPYVSGDFQVEAMRVLCTLFERFGVDIVFNSHTMVYERSFPLLRDTIDFNNGVTYIVVGGVGSRPHWFHNKRAWHTAQSLAVPHFVQVVIAANHLELQAVDRHGQVFDRLLLAK